MPNVSERLDTIFTNAVDPNGVVFDPHFIGEVSQPIFVFAEVSSVTRIVRSFALPSGNQHLAVAQRLDVVGIGGPRRLPFCCRCPA